MVQHVENLKSDQWFNPPTHTLVQPPHPYIKQVTEAGAMQWTPTWKVAKEKEVQTEIVPPLNQKVCVSSCAECRPSAMEHAPVSTHSHTRHTTTVHEWGSMTGQRDEDGSQSPTTHFHSKHVYSLPPSPPPIPTPPTHPVKPCQTLWAGILE